MANPFDLSADDYDPKREAAAFLEEQRPAISEQFYQSIGKPQTFERPEPLGWGKNLVNALVGKETGGFHPFAMPEPAGRIDPATLSPEEQQTFYDQPKLTQLIQASRHPGGIVAIAQSKVLSDYFFAEEPTAFQELVGILPKIDQPEHRAALTNQILDMGVEQGFVRQETADFARRMYETNQLTQDEHSNVLKLSMTRVGSQEESDQKNTAIEDYLKNIAEKRAKAQADLVQSYASAESSVASAESARATAANTRRGKLYVFPDGKEFYDSEPEFKVRRDRGETGLLVGSFSGTEAGVGSVVGRGAQSRAQEELAKYAGQMGSIEQWVEDVTRSPNVVGPAGAIAQTLADPLAGLFPGLSSEITQTITGTGYYDFSHLRNRIDLYQSKAVRPIVDEGRFTDPERKMSAERSGDTGNPAEQLRARAATMWGLTMLNVDKLTYLATGGQRFGYDLTGDPETAEAAASELDMRMKRMGIPEARWDKYKELLHEQQTQLRKMRIEDAQQLYGDNLQDRLRESAAAAAGPGAP